MARPPQRRLVLRRAIVTIDGEQSQGGTVVVRNGKISITVNGRAYSMRFASMERNAEGVWDLAGEDGRHWYAQPNPDAGCVPCGR